MRAPIILLAGFLSSAAWGAQDRSSAFPEAMAQAVSSAVASGQQRSCRRENSSEVVVCGRSQAPYRIDPAVLAAARIAEAPPPKPPLTAAQADHCTGPDCGGATIPLVGMALTALKAAELAAAGEDWRDAFRTHPDQYQLYERSKSADGTRRGFSFSASVGNTQR